MDYSEKKLMICLMIVVILAVLVGIFYWYAGGINMGDGTVLVDISKRGTDLCRI